MTENQELEGVVVQISRERQASSVILLPLWGEGERSDGLRHFEGTAIKGEKIRLTLSN